jgi:hypothetical protein
MANYYLQFSETLLIKSSEQKEWIKRMLDPVVLLSTGEIVGTEPIDDSDYESMPRFVAEAVIQQRIDQEDSHDVGFQHEFYLDEPVPNVLLYAEECGEPERAGLLVQRFLQQFDPTGHWTLSWATTCSKSRPGSFGGGCLIVFADRIEIESTDDQIFRWTQAAEAARG